MTKTQAYESSTISVDPPREELLRLQRLLLPASLPAIGCTETAAAYRAHNDEFTLGGDWFDLIDRPGSNSVVAIVGDVVGHGVEQIGVMGQLRAASSALAHSLDSPAEIMVGLDRFARTLPGAEFTTLCIVAFDGSEHARICSAGHPPPVLVTANGCVSTVATGRRTPLTFGEAEASDGTFALGVGDLVVLYTDGVIDRPGSDLNAAIDGLCEFVAHRRHDPCIDLATAIVDDFGADAKDDQAVLVLRPIHERSAGYDRHEPMPSPVAWSAHS